jgi:hypothetical protein
MMMQETEAFSPCIELPALRFSRDEFDCARRNLADSIKECNQSGGCFSYCGREVGILWRKKWRAAANSHRVIPQILKYGNFF